MIFSVNTITNAFLNILDKSNRKPNKIWVDEFSDTWMKLWIEKNEIEIYSTHNKGKSVVTEIFIRTLKNKIYKCLSSISKTVYVDKLDIVNKYNDTYIS